MKEREFNLLDEPWVRVMRPDCTVEEVSLPEALLNAHGYVDLAVIVALGLAPGLGFVHVGHERSFVYDVADLYKAEVTIPIAFQVAAQAPEDLPGVTRRAVRDALVERHILERMVHDIRALLLPEDAPEPPEETVYLWDNTLGAVPNAINYSHADREEPPS